jgi:hypothetical protein
LIVSSSIFAAVCLGINTLYSQQYLFLTPQRARRLLPRGKIFSAGEAVWKPNIR